MKKFVVKVVLFAILLGIILVEFYNINSRLIKETSFKLRDDVVTVITGNSTMQYGLNTQYLNFTENISVESEPLFMSYFKLKEILNNNHHIKNVVVPFSFLDVRRSRDSFLNFSDDDGLKKDLYSKCCCIHDLVPYSCLREFDVDDVMFAEVFIRNRVFLNFIYFARKLRCNNYDRTYLRHIGQFNKMWLDSLLYLNSYSVEYIDKAIEVKFSGEGLAQKYTSYLDSIANLCSIYNKLLIVVNTPNYPDFNRKIPDEFKLHYYEKLNRLKKSDNVLFFDYSDLIEDHALFWDETHLNWRGAEVLSKELASRLNDIANVCCTTTPKGLE